MCQKQISAVEAKEMVNKAMEDYVKGYLPKIMENIFDLIRNYSEVGRTAICNVDPLEDYRNRKVMRPMINVMRPMIVEILQGLGYKVTVTSDDMTIDWGTPLSDATDDQPSQDAIIIRHGVGEMLQNLPHVSEYSDDQIQQTGQIFWTKDFFDLVFEKSGWDETENQASLENVIYMLMTNY